jgi:Holliday junction resolvase RusA-like endonuclease
MKLNHEQLKAMFERNPSLRKANETNPTLGGALPHPKPQQNHPNALAVADGRKEKSIVRSKVCITSFRTRTIDTDNLIGGAKFLIDALRRCELIGDDSPEYIALEMRQQKVAKRSMECTIVEISEE